MTAGYYAEVDHLLLRMPIHSNNAMQLAAYLESHPKIEEYYIPRACLHTHHINC